MTKKDSQTPKQPKKASSVRHTRAIQRDRQQRSLVEPPHQQVASRLDEIVKPATLAQVAHFHQRGLRERTLSLPIMVAFLLSVVWRQISGVSELARLVSEEALLWADPVRVSQQALSQRLSSLPAELFAAILRTILPVCQARWGDRERPLPPELAWAQAQYTGVFAADGSTLDALIRKLGLLKDQDQHPLAGKMTALLDIVSRLPVAVWYEADAKISDQQFWSRIQGALSPGSLLLFDLGYTNFALFQALGRQGVTFITRAKSNLRYEVVEVLQRRARLHDRIVLIGKDDTRQQVRLIEVLHKGRWYRYLSNELDPDTLPVAYAVALYWQRWRVEDAYKTVKRLLGLAYFWSGSQNAVQLQLWTIWILYAVLVDLTDAVAETLQRPFAALSMEMVYRSLYYFTRAHERGETTDLVNYLSANAQRLGIIKRRPTPSRLADILALTSLDDP